MFKILFFNPNCLKNNRWAQVYLEGPGETTNLIVQLCKRMGCMKVVFAGQTRFPAKCFTIYEMWKKVKNSYQPGSSHWISIITTTNICTNAHMQGAMLTESCIKSRVQVVNLVTCIVQNINKRSDSQNTNSNPLEFYPLFCIWWCDIQTFIIFGSVYNFELLHLDILMHIFKMWKNCIFIFFTTSHILGEQRQQRVVQCFHLNQDKIFY